MAALQNLVNLKDVTKGYSSREILTEITLGINEGDRIGVVGRNGDGKSTLLKMVAGAETPDSGKLTSLGGIRIALLGQGDDLDPRQTIRQELIGERADHQWAGDARFRDILDGLLGGVELDRFPLGLDTQIAPLSGGERRRIALAKALIDESDLLILDEPTNHLDIEGVDWLAHNLAKRQGALLVVTHDRWFLDEVCTQTWEVADRQIHQYEGGYAAYVLARAERDRQEAAQDQRRRALIRKELAWLRRGPPARTTKPKFRIDAANELIADEPPARNSVELLKFATARLGNRVIDAINITLGFGDGPPLLDHVTWRLGPGDRVGLVGVNGAGKTTLIRLLAGDIEPATGSVKRGQTVHVAELSQDTVQMREDFNVMETLEESRLIATLHDGGEISASMLCDRFGFRGPRARTLVKDLSGGERRRLQLMCLLMEEPNVLLLDEPTNDLDIDTLTALEDLLDSWPGTIVVVSHDRYFVERVCDNVYGLMGDGQLRHLPRGIEQYVELRRAAPEDRDAQAPTPQRAKPKSSAGAIVYAARKDAKRITKEVRRLERELQRVVQRETELHDELETHASNHERLGELTAEISALGAEREQLESDWLAASELLER